MAIVDRNGLYGAVRFHMAAKKVGIHAHIGSEITCTNGRTYPLLVESRDGYQNLCRLVTRMKLRAPKGEGAATLEELAEFSRGLVCLTRHPDAQVRFNLADLCYQFPTYPAPDGHSEMSYLRKLTEEGARRRYHPYHEAARKQIERELALIKKLKLPGYFLIVWDIVDFCRRNDILCQGRGSAANSAVCYALGITAVDPVKMDLLFERFLSEERGEWPDIDLDLPSGDQRERVIQHVYKRYGEHGAAMTANVITYRDRSAAREVAKSLGFSLEQADKLSKCMSTWHFGEIREPDDETAEVLASAGFDPSDLRVQHFMRLQMQIQNLPRHMGQHSGGLVMPRG